MYLNKTVWGFLGKTILYETTVVDDAFDDQTSRTAHDSSCKLLTLPQRISIGSPIVTHVRHQYKMFKY